MSMIAAAPESEKDPYSDARMTLEGDGAAFQSAAFQMRRLDPDTEFEPTGQAAAGYC
jgi:hypothetical protein